VKIYIGASMADILKARQLAGFLGMNGHEITFPWFDLPDIAEEWPRSKRAMIAEKEVDGVRRADVGVFLAPGGRGMHVEIGVALGLRKPVLLIADLEPKFALFYEHALVRKLIAPSRGALLETLAQVGPKPSPSQTRSCTCGHAHCFACGEPW
jgi:nucleoside 2-deoxyribosyltransferase